MASKRNKSVKAIVYDGVRVELEDFSAEVRGNLKKLQRRGLSRSGTLLVKEVRNVTPKRSGLLRATINKQVKLGGSGIPWLKIGALKEAKGSKFGGSFAHHAHLIEFGTGIRYNKSTTPKRLTGSGKEYANIRNTIRDKKSFVRQMVGDELSKIEPGVLPEVADDNP